MRVVNNLIVFIFILISSNLFAQNNSAIWSDAIDNGKESASPEILYVDSLNIYLLNGRSVDEIKHYYIEVISRNNLTTIKKIEFNDILYTSFNNNIMYSISKIKNSNNFLVLSTKKETRKVLSYYGSIIDFDGKIIVEKKLINTDHKKDDANVKRIVISSDSLGLILLKIIEDEISKNTILSYELFDKNLISTDNNFIRLLYQTNKFRVNSYTFTTKKVFINAILIGDEVKRGKNIIITIDRTTNTFTEFEVPKIGEYVIEDITFLTKDNEYFNSFSLFTNIGEKNDYNYYVNKKAQGLTYTKFNPENGHIKTQIKFDFNKIKLPNEDKKLFINKNNLLKQKFNLQSVYLITKDTLLFVLTHHTFKNYLSNYNSRYTEEIIYKNVVFLKCDTLGNILNSAILPINQFLISSSLTSYRHFKMDENFTNYVYKNRKLIGIYPINFSPFKFIYLDNPKNILLKKFNKPDICVLGCNSKLFLGELSGNYVNKSIYKYPSNETEDLPFNIAPKYTLRLSKNEFLMLKIESNCKLFKSTHGFKIGILKLKN